MSRDYVTKEVAAIITDKHYEAPLNLAMASAWIMGNFKGLNLKVLDLRKVSGISDFFVIGSASKIFKYFLNKYNFKGTIVSYSDKSIFDGNLYEKLGFKNIHDTDPNYFWIVRGNREHRFKWNKKKLVKLGFDSNKSESDIMNSMGNYKIWSCGQKRYERIIS